MLAREEDRLDAAAGEAADAAQTLAEVAAAVEHCAGADVPLEETQV